MLASTKQNGRAHPSEEHVTRQSWLYVIMCYNTFAVEKNMNLSWLQIKAEEMDHLTGGSEKRWFKVEEGLKGERDGRKDE